MRRKLSIVVALSVVMVFVLVGGMPSFAQEGVQAAPKITQGVLRVIDKDGKPKADCPLRHTSVTADISGFVARVTVKQVFHNPFEDKIEAIYIFPLSARGAVDAMLMKVGERTIRGVIKRREEARKIYEQAKSEGKIASLLDQERPNIFTQSVANIRPGEQIEITIKYVEMLPYEDGKFTFSFPTVVGPRFIPGEPVGREGTGREPDTTEVPDASKITPQVTPAGTRAGHDIDLTVNLDAGVKILNMESKLHDVEVAKDGDSKAKIALKNKKTIPNKDFVLEYAVAGDKVKSGTLVHKDGKYGYITIVLIPPKKPRPEQIAPKEMIFVIDRSGSQRGLPLQKAKETMSYILDNMNPEDTFNVVCFSRNVDQLFEKPRKKSDEMVKKAKGYIGSLTGSGGTWMGPAVETVCAQPAEGNRLRIITFMTDGYVGNDFAILGLVKKLRGKSRWFPFGTGNSVNRFLLDNMAKLGGGEVDYVLLNSPGEKVAKKFYNRISTPVLTDIKVEFEGIELEEVFPREVSDLWAQKPLYFHARYKKAGKGKVYLKGFFAGKPYQQELDITLPETEKSNEVTGPVWARAKVDMLMNNDLFSAQRGSVNKELREEIILTALEHHIMTQYTSFVAVEETIITVGGKPRKVAVPVEMPEGVSREGVFGEKDNKGGKQFGAGPGQRRMARGGGGRSGGKSAELAKKKPDSPMEAPPPRPSENAEEPPEEEKPDETKPLTPEEKQKLLVEKRKLLVNQRTHKSLIGLAEKVAKEGKDGSLKLDKLEVSSGKVMVNIYLADNSEEVLKKIKELGIEILFEATTRKIIIASVPVDKLEDLVQLKAVKWVEPSSE